VLKKIKAKIESKRNSENIFWKLLVKNKDFLWKFTLSKAELREWETSYNANNFGDIFYALVRLYKPELIVELGTGTGYTTLHMAKALRDDKKGRIDSYDLWENYKFKNHPLRSMKKGHEGAFEKVEAREQARMKAYRRNQEIILADLHERYTGVKQHIEASYEDD